jgi:hypothetical protein
MAADLLEERFVGLDCLALTSLSPSGCRRAIFPAEAVTSPLRYRSMASSVETSEGESYADQTKVQRRTQNLSARLRLTASLLAIRLCYSRKGEGTSGIVWNGFAGCPYSSCLTSLLRVRIAVDRGMRVDTGAGLQSGSR